ncbi:acetylornithine deacetylase [Microvirga sp. W0021]|uniref:Acetylornithine deacetylase n=1 Tax=Hohaiivirga grylli TaxID=3133970 RepID=A0ABV0BFX9_9HYPH
MGSQSPLMKPLEMLEKLVSFNTESSNSNLPLIDFVETYLKNAGVFCRRFPNAEGNKAALYASVGPKDRGGVVLSGHSDVVPVTGQAWTSDPYKLRVADGRAYGRGAVDMKSFDALSILALAHAAQHDLKVPLHMVLSYDEETTCLGSNDAIAQFGKDLAMPIAAIIGEPTELQVTDAHKGCTVLTTMVYGSPAHSSKPYLGASAVMAGGDVMAAINRLSDEMIEKGDASGRFDPPYTSVHIGEVHGGTARNILAKECMINWEIRGLPDQDPEEILKKLAVATDEISRSRLNRYGDFGRIETTCPVSIPGLRPEPGSVVEKLCLELTGNTKTISVPYATEAGHFQKAGIPTIVCGPGSIDPAHQPDEFITLEQLDAGEAFMQGLLKKCVEGSV